MILDTEPNKYIYIYFSLITFKLEYGTYTKEILLPTSNEIVRSLTWNVSENFRKRDQTLVYPKTTRTMIKGSQYHLFVNF